MRLLGIDFGLKRVGLALTDPAGTMAFPRPAIVRTTSEALFTELAEIASAEAVEAVVVGLPLGLNGQETLTTRQARNFASKLAARTGLPVHFADERLTSADAEERLREAGVSARKMKGLVDSQAAVLILETYLGSRS